MWTLWKVRFSKCEFLDKLRDFAPVCIVYDVQKLLASRVMALSNTCLTRWVLLECGKHNRDKYIEEESAWINTLVPIQTRVYAMRLENIFGGQTATSCAKELRLLARAQERKSYKDPLHLHIPKGTIG